MSNNENLGYDSERSDLELEGVEEGVKLGVGDSALDLTLDSSAGDRLESSADKEQAESMVLGIVGSVDKMFTSSRSPLRKRRETLSDDGRIKSTTDSIHQPKSSVVWHDSGGAFYKGLRVVRRQYEEHGERGTTYIIAGEVFDRSQIGLFGNARKGAQGSSIELVVDIDRSDYNARPEIDTMEVALPGMTGREKTPFKLHQIEETLSAAKALLRS